MRLWIKSTNYRCHFSHKGMVVRPAHREFFRCINKKYTLLFVPKSVLLLPLNRFVLQKDRELQVRIKKIASIVVVMMAGEGLIKTANKVHEGWLWSRWKENLTLYLSHSPARVVWTQRAGWLGKGMKREKVDSMNPKRISSKLSRAIKKHLTQASNQSNETRD